MVVAPDETTTTDAEEESISSDDSSNYDDSMLDQGDQNTIIDDKELKILRTSLKIV